MSFSAKIAAFGPKAAARVNDVRRGVTMKLFSAVILDTPVDEGTLRANWQITANAPASGTIDDTDKSGGKTIKKLEAPIKQSSGDTPLFLTNNLPYAGKIEFEGWSRVKAPEGMVRRNVVRFGRLIKVQVNSLKK